MKVLTTIAEARAALDEARAGGARVGFVPTMGALHPGHRSLLERAVADCDVTAVSIFVNPLQFAPHEDLARYPRPLQADLAMATEVGVDVAFVPSVDEMYPPHLQPVATSVRVAGVTDVLEGASRPGHFDGVATVVTKLFHVAGPCRAYFGEKDWQQVAVIRRMVADLSTPVTVVPCPTVREADGLALSSRNAYLDPAQRAAAPVVQRALQAGVAAIDAGERSRDVVEQAMGAVLATEPLGAADYCVVVDASTLRPVDPLAGELRLLAAVRFGPTRLIDNVGVVAVPASGSDRRTRR